MKGINKSKFSITYDEYILLTKLIKNKEKKTLEDNCYIKMFEMVHKFKTELSPEDFISERQEENRNEYLKMNDLELTPNFNILYNLPTDNFEKIIKSNRFGLIEYTYETENRIRRVAIQLPLFGEQWIKIEKKSKNEVAFVYCFTNRKSYLVARKVLSEK